MKNSEPISVTEANAMSSLALAHVGDAVYELLVRSMLASRGPAAVHDLHRQTVDLHRQTVAYVRAEAQAATVKRLLPLLSEEETAVYKRGRNSHVHGIPAHANPGEYHSATGLEALLGWLYLTGRQDRIRELFDAVTED